MNITKKEALAHIRRLHTHLNMVRQSTPLSATTHSALKTALQELEKATRIISSELPRPVTERTTTHADGKKPLTGRYPFLPTVTLADIDGKTFDSYTVTKAILSGATHIKETTGRISKIGKAILPQSIKRADGGFINYRNIEALGTIDNG
ncbi:hypothetical protein D9B85_05860 [Corynebacterium diphtheriae]|uniref:hypothetical protein n=1 Tax=Corynebacterium diphtheriae TaxID=1717 RepID=UPI000F1DD0F5|nr:hypothetical protein [Corynebacterium diphtheriae]MBG9296496.1 hypothetical protein [Corynebacterium diphtheriae bv. gravis]MBG9339343.1 hypothetical protein [Corynebacterium diphtheriae bv. mitis]RKW91335.1 hypothetical protein D9B36_05730 [Corynebacterium diphtheriae]RKX01544.1 hypothetical protein D9B85_05860 [Corynebacterium diphtheriae]RLP08686.1 hypothetical protein D9R17_06450 [Corynebacterium diphtheriae]